MGITWNKERMAVLGLVFQFHNFASVCREAIEHEEFW
jgi:hypothetical protein